jgi:hypothetical protein
VTGAKNTPDATLRQRMVGTPQGAVFYVNYAGVNAEIWLADATDQSGLVTRKLSDMEPGVKLTAIAYSAGLTFLAGQFLAESGATPRSMLWVLDVNNVPQRIGYFRRDDPDPGAPLEMQAYESDLWIIQGSLVWRYSITSGGLFCETALNNATASGNRGIAVMQGRVFVANNTDGVWVTGSVGTYRQSGVEGASAFVSSAYDFSLPGKNKLLRSIQLLTEVLPSETQVAIEYQLDGDGTWVSAGVATLAQSQHTFLISTEDATVTFGSIQVRITPQSLDGTATPIVKACIISAFLNEDNEFFQLRLLCQDPAKDQTIQFQSGGQQARTLWALHNSGSLTTFLDGYDERSMNDDGRSYLVSIDALDQQNSQAGEGVVLATLRVIAG